MGSDNDKLPPHSEELIACLSEWELNNLVFELVEKRVRATSE